MSDLPQPRSYESILSDMLSTYAARIGINDFNVGSAVTTFFETNALAVARASGDVFQILKDFSVDRATGDALKRLAVENRVTSITAKPSSGLVTITDTSFEKISTKVYAGATPPNIGSTQIKVSDASLFPGTGSIYIGRGTPNIEGPIPYTSITPSGNFFIINLSIATTKFHNVGESVILAQGGNRSIPANTIVLSPAVGSNPDIKFATITSSIILDGETVVDNVQVTAQTPGKDGNIPRGAIKEFAAPPFSGASVTNTLPFTTGRDNETDDELRVRIKRALASKGLGTATAVKSSVIGATPSDEQATVVSDEIVSEESGATLYVDDGTGYEAKTAGVGLESIVDSALGGEKLFQLATGGRQAPVAKAFLQSTFTAPFDLIGGDTLSIVVGEQTYQHVFASSDFVSPGGATAFEVIASINANTNIGFEATTSGGGTSVIIRAKEEGNDSLQVTTPTTSGRDAAVLLGLPTNKIETLRLYKNKTPLNKDGKTASVFTQSQQLWSATISNGDTLILSVDGTAAITYTITDADFIATGLYNNVASTNSLESWTQVFNNKLTGVTVSIVGQQLKIVSNLGASNRAKVVIDPASTLVSKGMFSSLIGLSSTGKASDFTLSRNTAQFKLTDPLEVGDQLTAGSVETEARIQSDQIPGGSVTFASDAHIWFLIDASGEVIPTGVAGATQLSVSKPSTNVVRYTSSVPTAFANVEEGDYVIIWSEELNANNRLEGRVFAKTSSTLDILVTSAEYAAAVVESGVVFSDGFVVLRSDLAPQKFRITSGIKTLEDIVLELQDQTANLLFDVFQDQYITVRTTTKDTAGVLLVVTADVQGKLVGFPINESDVSKDSLIAFYDSQFDEAELPLFIHALFASGTAADPIDSFITSATTSISFSGRDPNELVRVLHPYGSVKDAQPYYEYAQVKSISGATINITNNPNIRRLRTVDRFFIANPLDFGSADTAVVVLDNDANSKSFEIPFYRKGLTNTTLANNPSNFNAYDLDAGPTTNFSSNFGSSFDFSNFKVLMRAKKTLKPTPAQTALLYRSVKWGRTGEKITVGYIYPSSPNNTIGHTVQINSGIDIKINLKSGPAIPTSIDNTTEWDVTVTANTPVAGVDQVTFTWNGNGTNPALSLSGGEYVNISTQTEFSEGNTGIFRVSTEVGFTPTATSFSVQMPNGQGVAETGKATAVNGAIAFYSTDPTTAAEIKTYVDTNLSDLITATIVNDGGVTGSGVIELSTYEDSDFSFDSVQLKDGINWIASSNLGGSPQFTFKTPLTLSSDVGYAFNDGEELRIVPTTQDQVLRFLKVLAVTGFTTVGDINVTLRGTKLELSTNVLGSLGAIQVIGGTANQYQVPILDSAIRIDNSLAQVSVDEVAAQGVHSDQWFKLQATTAQRKDTLFSSNSSITVVGDTPSVGKATVQLLGRAMNQRYLGKPRHHLRTKTRNFRVEKHGALTCLSWDGSGSSPQFKKSSLNFDSSGGGTLNVSKISGSSDALYTILTGDANFNELSIGDLVTVSGLPVAENNGTFLVTGISEDGTELRVLNPSAENEFSSGTFTFSGNATAGDVFIFNGEDFISGYDFVVGGSAAATATNLGAILATLPDVSVSVVGTTVTVNSTLSIPAVSINYTGNPVVNVTATFTLNSNVIAGDVFTVNGTDLVAGTSFVIGGSASATATNLAAAINSLSGVSASALGSVVTVTPTPLALLELEYKGSPVVDVDGIYDLTANATAGDIFTVGASNLVTGVHFMPGGTIADTAENLANAISVLPGVTSFASGNVTTVVATSVGASIALAYSGFPVVTVSGPFLVGDSYNISTFTASSEVSEGDTVIISAPFAVLNQGKFRVIRRYEDSIWFENPNTIEEEVTLPSNLISLGFDSTTSFKVNATNNSFYLNWNGVGTEPNLENAKVGDILTVGIDFLAANRGDFMVLRSGKKLQEITELSLIPGSAFTIGGAGKYFLINSAGDTTEYYVWFDVNNSNSDPAVVGKTGIEVDILSGDNASQVATKTAVAIAAVAASFTATASDNIVTVTTVGYQETTNASNFNVPTPFSIQIKQDGRRTFLECINPSAVNEATVLVTAGVLQCHRPQMQFFEYEAAVAGDKFVVTGDALGTTNNGSFVIEEVLDRDSAIVEGSLSSIFNASLNGKETAVYVEEGVVYSGYKKVSFVSAQPGAPTRNVLVFDTNQQYEKITEAASVTMTSLNKENFLTTVRKGLDSYRYNTGLIAEANRIIYGDSRDPITYPGVGAAGAEIFVREPLTRRIQVALTVRVNTGVPFAQTVEQVRNSVSSLINSNPVGQPIAISDIVSAVNEIPGVRAVAVSSPQYDSTHDTIFVAPSEKARIIDATVDISVSQIGT